MSLFVHHDHVTDHGKRIVVIKADADCSDQAGLLVHVFRRRFIHLSARTDRIKSSGALYMAGLFCRSLFAGLYLILYNTVACCYSMPLHKQKSILIIFTLRKKNRLMRSGQVEKAGALAKRIGR